MDEPRAPEPDLSGYRFHPVIDLPADYEVYDFTRSYDPDRHLRVPYGIGRYDMVENRLVGIQSREIYEAPAATILYTAHKELEALTLDREVSHYKETIALKYADLIYYGLWYSQLKTALDGFVEATQQTVTGSIKLKLFKGTCVAVGRKSPYSMYKKELATYGEEDTFDQKLAEGFIKIWGMPYKR